MKKKEKNNIQNDEHGIISIVQSPDAEKSKINIKNKTKPNKEHGIISTVQKQNNSTKNNLDK
jgi:hypothetical protein